MITIRIHPMGWPARPVPFSQKTRLPCRPLRCRMPLNTAEHNMGKATADSSSDHLGAGQFPPTHWTVVMDAGRDSSLEARGAFGELYRAYLPPLLAFLRRNGKTEEEAR